MSGARCKDYRLPLCYGEILDYLDSLGIFIFLRERLYIIFTEEKSIENIRFFTIHEKRSFVFFGCFEDSSECFSDIARHEGYAHIFTIYVQYDTGF